MPLDVVILGSGSAKPSATRCPSAHAVLHNRHLFLVDCGEGTQMQMCKCGLAIENVRAVFLTHLHADHVLGIFGLLASLSMSGRREDLDVYAHASFQPILEQNVRFFIVHMNFQVRFHAFDPEQNACVYEDRHLAVSTIPLRHRVPTAGFLFHEKPFPPNIRPEAIVRHRLGLAEIASLKEGHDVERESGEVIYAREVLYQKRHPVAYAYLSDTLYSERAASMVQGVDLLYHEATYMHELLPLARQTGHSTALQAGQFAALAHVGKLIIGHYSARYSNVHPLLAEARSAFPNVVLAREGEAHRVACH